MDDNIYKEILKQSPHSYIIHSIYYDNISNAFAFKFLEANDSFYNLFGLERGAGSGVLNESLLLNQIIEGFSWVAVWNEVVIENKAVVRNFFFNQAGIWLRINAFRVADDKLVTIISNNSNNENSEPATSKVTEICKSADTSNANEARFRCLFESVSNIAVQGYKSNGIVIFWNKASEILYGYSAEEAIGQNLLDLIIPENMRQKVSSNIKGMMLNGVGSQAEELLLKRKDGSFISVLSNHVVVNISGNDIEFFCIDISLREQKRTEESLRKLSMATEQSPASIVITDLKGNIEYVNPKFTELTGYTLQEVIGQNPRVLKSGETTDEIYKKLWQTISLGKEWHGVFKNKKKDGSFYYEAAVISPIINDEGNITHYVAVKEDITFSLQAEEAVLQQRRNLEILLEASQSFVSTIDADELVKIIVNKGSDVLNVEHGALFFIDGQKIRLVATKPQTSADNALKNNELLLVGLPVLKELMVSKKPQILDDTALTKLSEQEQEVFNFQKLRAIICLPLVIEQQVIGILILGSKNKEEKFPSAEVDMCRTMMAQAALVLENARLFNKMRSVSDELKLQNQGYARLNSELKTNNNRIQEINKQLQDAKERAEENQEKLIKSEERLKLKLDFLLSPDKEIPNLNITDLIDLKHLQTLQDSFAKATGVASVITNKQGVPITNSGNFNGVCKLIRETEIGRQKCFYSDSILGQMAAEKNGPVIEVCKSCGFLDAAAPIYIGSHLVAIWMIGQVCNGEVNAARIRKYSDEIGANAVEMLSEFHKITPMSRKQFEAVAQLLHLFARDISVMAYNNLLLARKIEEQKDFEVQLILAKDKAEESDRLKTAFLQNMSHEIRTPMNGILGFSQLLKMSGISEEKRKTYISMIIESTNRLLGIVNDIMDISRLEAGDVIIKSEPIALNELFDELYTSFHDRKADQVEFYKPILEKKNESLFLVSDGERLKQVMEKLLSNAIKFTQRGHIQFGCEKAGQKLRFFVKDTGIGVTPDKTQLIFKPFFQADMEPTREFEGNGLGLTIASRIVEKMGSQIEVDSNPGLGSCFYFDLRPQLNIIEEGLPLSGSFLVNLSEVYTILVAEDDLINYLFIQDALEDNQEGVKFVLHHAQTGLEAIDLMRKHEDISLVLMDIKMPEMDGITATRIIKKEYPKIPVIAQTALALSNEHEKAMEAGCDAYLTKPIRRDWLLQTVYRYLQELRH